MGRILEKGPKSPHTFPSSPSHSFSSSSSSSSSSDFEFTISVSPRKSSTTLCRPADELFYKGQLLPLHLSPRISMLRTLLLASSSNSSSSDSNTTPSRDSTGSSASNDSHSSFNSDLAILGESACNSSRPSSVTELDDEFKRLNNLIVPQSYISIDDAQIKKTKYFSLSKLSSVFKKETNKNINRDQENASGSSVKRMIRKYLKKVKPLYEKLSQKQQQQQKMTERSSKETEFSGKSSKKDNNGGGGISHSFSGNLRNPKGGSNVSSCPSSMRSSPSHYSVLSHPGFAGKEGGSMYSADTSSIEELQSAIQGAIAHCKNSLIQNNTMVSNEI